jgi:hypothetical protein
MEIKYTKLDNENIAISKTETIVKSKAELLELKEKLNAQIKDIDDKIEIIEKPKDI